MVLVALIGAPLGAQDRVDDPGLAPAIGRWRNATRGIITEMTPGDDAITVAGVTRDPDSAQPVSYEILLDGELAASGRTNAASDFGANVNFEETITASPGLHEVCLRLDDPALGRRTVHCTDAITSPPSRVAQAVADRATGVAISETGIVLPITGGSPGNLEVTTPCGATTRIDEAAIVDRVQVLIDPGHGGSESGAVGAGLQEKNVNLVVSNVLLEKLNDLGISAQLTRTADYRIPLGTRAQMANALAPDIFLSLHHNGGAVRRSSEPGTEIFYGQARPESQRLAGILYEEMHAAASQFEADWVDTINQGASTRLNDSGLDLFGIHRFTPDIDSVITEFLYLSNPSEAALMREPEVIEAQAQSIVDGILRWYFDDADDPAVPGRRFTDPSSSGTGGFDNCVDPALNGTSTALSSTSAEVQTNAALGVPQQAPEFSLLPALVLRTDPAIEG